MGKIALRAAALAAGLVLAFSGCAAQPLAARPLAASPVVQSVAVVKGTGKVKYATGGAKLTSSQKELVLAYMKAYYDSVAKLEPVSVTSLFAGDAKRQRQSEQIVINTLCDIRGLQKTNLRLNSYSYTLTITQITVQDDDDVMVLAEEDCVQRFAAYSKTDAKSYNMGHRFLLTKTEDGWKLRDHRRHDSLTEALRGEYPANPSASTVKKTAEKLLKDAKKEVSRRQKRGTEPKKKNIQVDHEYRRKTAVSYSRKWVQGRNREGNWPDYGHWGGNCQNFVSQCLYASGIPMDIESPGLWKWYGPNANKQFNDQGRSTSWASVNDFLAYVKSNDGYGLVAHADAPYYSGEIGDIIHMGTGGSLKHTVIITKVIKNANGDTIDYLVSSNTADLRDYPVSAHYYTDQMLIKVYGWNDSPEKTSDATDTQDPTDPSSESTEVDEDAD